MHIIESLHNLKYDFVKKIVFACCLLTTHCTHLNRYMNIIILLSIISSYAYFNYHYPGTVLLPSDSFKKTHIFKKNILYISLKNGLIFCLCRVDGPSLE